MKKLILLFPVFTLALGLLTSYDAKSQNVGISDVVFTPNTQAILDLSSDRKGFLPPRVILVSADNPINGTKPEGLIVYNEGGSIGSNGFYYWDGTTWKMILTGGTTVSGSGTLNYLPKWTPDGSTLGNSQFYDDGTNIGIGTSSPNASYKATVVNGNNEVRLAGSSIGLYTEVNAGGEDGIYSLHTSTSNASAYYAVRGEVQNESGIGYLGYHTSGDRSYGVYGASGTFAGYFEGNTNIATGNVGIGTNSAASDRLVVAGGRVEFTNNNEATGTTGTGVLEIDNTLRFDGNEIITSTGTPLNINYDNNTNVTIDGTDNTFYVDGSNNRVGIGTNAPSTALDVNGQIRMRSGAVNGYVPVSDGTGLMTWTDPNTVFDDNDWTRNTGSGYLYPNTLSDKVGIGTSIPATNLNVYNGAESPTQTNFTQAIGNSGVLITGDFADNNYNSGIFWNTQNNNPTKPKAGIYVQHANAGSKMILSTSTDYTTGLTNNALVIDDMGNIGIGTVTPGRNMDVVGSIRSTNSGEIVDINADGNNPAIELRDNDGSGLTPFIDFSNDGSTDFDGRIRLTGDDYLAIEGANLGIGTSAPAEALHVSGNVRASSLSGSGNRFVVADVNGTLSATSSTSAGIVTGSGTTNYMAKFTSSGVVGNSQMYDNGTYVGVGHASPAFKMDVRDDAGGPQILARGTGGSNTDHAIGFIYGTGSDWVGKIGHLGSLGNGWSLDMWTDEGYPITFWNGSTEKMRIASSGYVGVGTTNPQTMLHIYGAEGSGSGYLGVMMGGGASGNSKVEIRGGTSPYLDFSNDAGTDYDARIILTSDNDINIDGAEVGIGISNPLATLHVNGTGAFNGLLEARGGFRTNKTYRYYTRTTGGTRDISLGAWDFCALAGVYFHHSDDNGDDTKQNCRVYSWSEVSSYNSRATDYSYDWTKNYTTNNNWWLWLDNSSDTGDQVACDAICIDFE